MIIFGETKNICALGKRPVRHLGARKFVPVFERTREEWFPPNYLGRRGEPSQTKSSYYTVPTHEKRGVYEWWQVGKTSKPKMLWAIARKRIRKLGQRDFFKKIFGEKNHARKS